MDRKIGILGTGHIASKMAGTIARMNGCVIDAVASRTREKADEFAGRFGISKAYSSYEELVADPEIELVYIATPHSHHYEHAMLCLEAGKAVLCEKAFTANAREAEALIRKSEEKGVFITEAIWTRYMPLSLKIMDLVREETVGKPHTLTANLCYPISGKERVQKPELAGGALLDIGIYPLNFAAMVFGDQVESMVSACTKTATGVDAQETITQFYPGERMAVLHSGIYSRSDRQGIISCDQGFILVENINNPSVARIFNADYVPVAEYYAPPQITGFEYEVAACFDALDKGLVESPFMPHSETLRMMRMMDSLRKEWGVAFPNDSREI